MDNVIRQEHGQGKTMDNLRTRTRPKHVQGGKRIRMKTWTRYVRTGDVKNMGQKIKKVVTVEDQLEDGFLSFTSCLLTMSRPTSNCVLLKSMTFPTG
jgi:hypothetical protein